MTIRKKAETTLFFSFIISVILGTLFHFAFEYTGGNQILGAFVPINESIWEHLKLILLPSIIVGIMEYFIFGRHSKGYFGAKGISTLIGMLFLLVGYYTYSGIIGADLPIVNIFLFIVGAAITSTLTYFLTFKTNFSDKESIIGILIITVLLIAFMNFTFNPPMLELFRDPLSGDFGIPELYL